MASSSAKPRVPASLAARRMARGLAWARCWAVGNCARMPRARAEQIAEGRPVLRQHDVELRDELAQRILPIVHEPSAEARELAQALDLLVGHIAGLGGPGAEEPGDDLGVDVIRLGLAADDVTVAPGLQRIQHDDAVASADERRVKGFPPCARGPHTDP